MKKSISILGLLFFFISYAEDPGGDFVCDGIIPPSLEIEVFDAEACPGTEGKVTFQVTKSEGTIYGHYEGTDEQDNFPLSFTKVTTTKPKPFPMPDKFMLGSSTHYDTIYVTAEYEDCGGGTVTINDSDGGSVSLKDCGPGPKGDHGPKPPKPGPTPGPAPGPDNSGGNGGGGGGGNNDEKCDEPAKPDEGVAEFFGSDSGWIVWPAPNEAWSEEQKNESTWFVATHRIVTINTPKERDLTGKMQLNKVSGDESCVKLFSVKDDAELPYALGQTIPIVEPGHFGCGVHENHQGEQYFGFIPVKAGQVVLEAVVDPDQGSPTKKAKITINIVEVIKLIVSSEKSGNGIQEFDGNQEWKFDSSAYPDPGKHLVVFFKDVINNNLEVQDFDVDLEAKINPGNLSEEQVSESWAKVSGESGELNKNDTFKVKLQNLTEGGVYKVQFDLGMVTLLPKSEANVVLPLAGAEVTDFVGNDMPKANIFAEKVLAEYPDIKNLGNLLNLIRLKNWFGDSGPMSNYLGRPDHIEHSTVIFYNQVADSGKGAVATWFKKPTRVSKLTNFMYAYTMAKIGFSLSDITLGGVVGTPDDDASLLCYQMGYNVANGSTYAAEGYNKINLVWQWTDDPNNKHRKLWPNLKPFNKGDFTSPGWLITKP